MKITVQKYNPAIDAAPYTKEYEVPDSENMTVLKALVYIHENIEPIAFDYSCRGRVCGRCAMMLDGVPCVACTTAIKGSKALIEPLAGFPIIKDLVVDKQEFHDKISMVGQRIRANEVITDEEIRQPIDYEKQYLPGDPLEWCARCGCCHSVCPVVHSGENANLFIGPTGLIALALRHFDPYDEGDRILQAVQEGLWNCIMCGKCDEVCAATEIHHLDTFQILRDEAEARGLTNKRAPYMPMGAE